MSDSPQNNDGSRASFPAATASGRSSEWIWICLLLALLLFSFIRLRLMDLPLERDEGEFAYAGQLLLEGVPPYKLAANMKLPGTYGCYALIMAVFGESPAGIRFGLTLVTSLTVILIFRLGRRFFGEWPGLAVGIGYGLLALCPGVLGLAAHANHFVVLFAVAGLLLLAESGPDSRWPRYFGSGLCFGLAILMKQHGLVFALFAAGWLCCRTGREPDCSGRKLLGRLGSFATGGATPLLLTGLALAWAGVFDRFWFWTVDYARAYAAKEPLAKAWRNFSVEFDMMAPDVRVLWSLAGLGLALLCAGEKTRRHAPFCLAFAACSLLAVSIGFYFRQQYFILLLPALALFMGAAVAAGHEWLAARNRPRLARYVPAVLFAAVCLGDLWNQRGIYFQRPLARVSRNIYGINPFPETAALADYIRNHSGPEATVAVLGSEPQIYFLSRRRSVTGLMYTYPLMENQPYARTMQQDMIREIETARPDFVVMVGMSLSWLYRPDSEMGIFRWFDSYWPQRYEVAALVDFVDPYEPEIRTGAAAQISPRSKNYIYLFRRKPEAAPTPAP